MNRNPESRTTDQEVGKQIQTDELIPLIPDEQRPNYIAFAFHISKERAKRILRKVARR